MNAGCLYMFFINNRCEEIIKEILIKTDNEKFYSFD